MSLIDTILENFLEFLPLTIVDEHEMGVYLRWGRYVKTVSPGGHRTIWPAEKIITVNTQMQNLPILGIDMVLGNNKVWAVTAAIAYTIENVYKYMLATREPDELITTVAKSLILGYKGTDKIINITEKVEEEIFGQLDDYAKTFGIAIMRFDFITMSMCKVIMLKGSGNEPILPISEE